jgi:microcystin degradation protein MlrC
VTTNNDQNLAEEKAQEIADLAWKLRWDFLAEVLPVREAVAEAIQSKDGPMVLADVADNPTGGASGDSAFILKELLRVGACDAVIATIADPEAVDMSIETGVGNRVTMTIGGKTDNYHGKPVEVDCKVKTISDGVFVHKGLMNTGRQVCMGRTAVIDCDGVDIILVEQKTPPHDLQLYRSVGIDPTDKSIIVVKSSVHFRASHEPIAKKIIEVDGPGLSSPRLAAFPFKKIPRPIFPLDTDMPGITELKKMEW